VEEALEGAGKPYMLSSALRDVAHKYVLQNVAIMQPWFRLVERPKPECIV
jgi:hypothetical protein